MELKPMVNGGMPTGPCKPDYPCWIPGTGFRVVVDEHSTCAVDDTYEAKLNCDDQLGSLLMFCTETRQPQVYVYQQVAPVSLTGSGILMLTAVLALWSRRRKC